MRATIDFESKEKYMDELGAGWVFNYTRPLGCSVIINGGDPVYFRNMDKLLKTLSFADTIVAHNVQYDVGILKMLGFNYSNVKIVDTMHLARMASNNLPSYKLDFLAKKFLKDKKSEEPLGEIAIKLGLVKTKRQNPVSIAKKNMDLIDKEAPEVVEEYANHDAVICEKLYQRWSYLA